MVRTKYGRQPFLDVIGKAGKSYRQVASQLGVPYLHLRNAGYGYVRPKDELREGLAEMFGIEVDRLFTGEILASAPHYGAKARRLMAEARARRDAEQEGLETVVEAS